MPKLGADPETSHLKLRWQDAGVIESIVGALKPVADFTEALAAEKQVTASSLKPMLDHLNTEALVANEGDTTLKTDIQNKIKQYMNTKYDNDNTRELTSLATILVPRLKSNYCTEEDKTTLQEKNYCWRENFSQKDRRISCARRNDINRSKSTR